MEGTAQRSVRVALVGCSGLLGEIIGRAVSAEADLEVVLDLPVPVPGQRLLPIDADVVVWNGADAERAADWLTRLGRRTTPRVLATVSDGREASLWELVPRHTALGALSSATLVRTIREAASPPGALA